MTLEDRGVRGQMDAAWLEVDRLGLGLPGSPLTMEGSQMRLEDRSVIITVSQLGPGART